MITVTFDTQSLRTHRRQPLAFSLATLHRLSGDAQLFRISTTTSSTGLIAATAYHAAESTLGYRDFHYFLDEANLSAVLLTTPANQAAVERLFTYAKAHQLFSEH
ncbi:hypothetical protein LL936_12950 [Levilactobacillus brevis]|uniref:hypothetical protein n=1 Tax=Levilactobacillus brevis TaxID=1580 RepID=UPI001144B925|nr:hypothetical protein [Levilactobacillus brevis]MBU7540933.1 hypothetical protein [Levilactobacillus brevis]MBU7560259.1 hypothetical protein [Levilactobacillus brevis]MBU7567092.1 hypothetical protein [Levilactobacillus brevis]MCE6011825.1 hypothetical protein [Levilactobacillus brevis]MCE6014194.1 hypothetical protein [Levilactobacillus brevis]